MLTVDHRLGLDAEDVILGDGFTDSVATGGAAGFDEKGHIYVQGRNFLENEQSHSKVAPGNVLQQLRKTGTFVPYV
jgi:hypothetical protein